MKNRIIISLLLFVNSLIFSRYYSPRDQWFIMKLNEGVKSWNKYIAGRKLSDRWAVIMSFAKFHNKNFDNIDLAGVQFYSLSLKNVKMRKSNLQETKLRTTDIINFDLSYSKLDRMWFSTINCENSKFYSVSFKGGQINGDKFYKVDLSNSILSNNRIECRVMWEVNFENSDLSNSTIMRHSWFLDCNFFNSNFNGVVFEYSLKDKTRGYGKIRFIGCNFINANLTGIVQLDNAAFTYSDMNGAKIERKWFNYLKTQEVKNFDKIRWQ